MRRGSLARGRIACSWEGSFAAKHAAFLRFPHWRPGLAKRTTPGVDGADANRAQAERAELRLPCMSDEHQSARISRGASKHRAACKRSPRQAGLACTRGQLTGAAWEEPEEAALPKQPLDFQLRARAYRLHRYARIISRQRACGCSICLECFEAMPPGSRSNGTSPGPRICPAHKGGSRAQ